MTLEEVLRLLNTVANILQIAVLILIAMLINKWGGTFVDLLTNNKNDRGEFRPRREQDRG